MDIILFGRAEKIIQSNHGVFKNLISTNQKRELLRRKFLSFFIFCLLGKEAEKTPSVSWKRLVRKQFKKPYQISNQKFASTQFLGSEFQNK